MRIKNLLQLLSDLPGFHTNRKLVLFSSDDWGGKRILSIKARENLLEAGIDIGSNRFDQFDTLESNEDLENLFEVLLRYKDNMGNHPIITAITCVANPDFYRIRENNFSEYFFEPFTRTLEHDPNRDRVYALYKKGIELNIFTPELHGREHLNVAWWLNHLQNKNSYVIKAFENEFWYLDGKYLNNPHQRGLDAAFDVVDLIEVEQQKSIVIESARIFKELFGYGATYFTPPSQFYHKSIEQALFESNIRIIDVPRLRKMPLGGGQYSTRIHYLGQKNKHGQFYLTRNVVFEPNLNQIDDGVNSCLSGIETAFMHKKPAIISNHRAAFNGSIEPINRHKGLLALDKVLKSILKKWPDVEFINFSELYFLMAEAGLDRSARGNCVMKNTN